MDAAEVAEVVAGGVAVEAAVEVAEAVPAEAALGEEGAHEVAVAPEEEAIARRPAVEAVLAVVVRAAAAELEAAHGPAGAGEAAEAPVPAPAPAVVADFAVASRAALEGAVESVEAREVESAEAIDRQRCHLAATSLGTDRAELVEQAVSEIVPAALVDPVALEIDPAESVAPVVSETGRVASADRAALEVGPVALVGLVASDDRVVSVAREALQIGPAGSVAPAALAIDPELGIDLDLVLEGQSAPALGLELAQVWRIGPEEAIAPSWATMSGTVETGSAIVATSRTIGAIDSRIAAIVSKTARRIAVIVSRTVRRTVAIVSKTVEIGWRTRATESKTAVIGRKTPAIGPITPRTIGGTFTTTGTTAPGTATGDMAPAGTTTRGPLGVSVPRRGD